MTLRPPTVLTRTVRYAHDGGRLLEHLAAAGLIATTTGGCGTLSWHEPRGRGRG